MVKKSKKIKTLDTTIHNSGVLDENISLDGLTDPRKIKVAQLLAYSGYTGKRRIRGCIGLASRECNINRQTIYYWLKTDPNFELAIEEARAELCYIALKGLEELAKEGNVGACIFLVERLAPEVYSNQYRRFQHDKEMLELKAKLKMPLDGAGYAPPVIVIQAPNLNTAEYRRNKIPSKT